MPVAVDQSRAGSLVWQHTWVIRGPGQDSVGVFAGFLPEVDVDKQINVIGSQARESGMVLTFTPSSSTPSEPSWRSITSSLSATGMDLSKTESLEFYAADGDSLTLVIDLGVTGEDALFIDDQGRTAGVKGNGTPWGLGRLDHEADPRLGKSGATTPTGEAYGERHARRRPGRCTISVTEGRTAHEEMVFRTLKIWTGTVTWTTSNDTYDLWYASTDPPPFSYATSRKQEPSFSSIEFRSVGQISPRCPELFRRLTFERLKHHADDHRGSAGAKHHAVPDALGRSPLGQTHRFGASWTGSSAIRRAFSGV